MTITATDFEYVASLVYQEAAIVLAPGKEYLVEARLAALGRAQGLGGAADVVKQLRAQRNPTLRAAVVDSMTTNETSFCRDATVFQGLKETVLPALIERRRSVRKLNIWSAACSTGQEPYTLAMMLDDAFSELRAWQVSIVATDLSAEVLAQARQGRYSQIEANRGLPARWLTAYFERSGLGYQLKADVKSKVQFRQLNLVRPWSLSGTFDLILCRNVLIYFDVATKQGVVRRLEQQLAADGNLLIGASESLVGVSDSLTRDRGAVSGCFVRARAVT